MALVPGIDPKHLTEAGWGVIFHEREKPVVREALRALLDHRRAQAGRLYREFSGSDGFCDGETKADFLKRHGTSLGPVHPHRMPYYLLIVGEPKLIPFEFQHQLDIQYAVGRVCFNTPEEYERYAKSVVEVETGSVSHGRRITLFGTRHPDDFPTRLSTDYMIQPLAVNLGQNSLWHEGWEVRSLLAEEATKDRLFCLLGGEETPALLFTASHGMTFSAGDPLQRAHQGALLCQDWPGPKLWPQAVPPDYYFSGDDVLSSARVQGLVVFHLASYSAGSPTDEEFAGGLRPPQAIAPDPFVAKLPQRLLAHPGGGALAVIGYVGRVWPYSFLFTVSKSVDAFESALRLVMAGHRVGFALEYFNQAYAELLSEIYLTLQRMDSARNLDLVEVAELWTASNEANRLAILGDPAVRVAVG